MTTDEYGYVLTQAEIDHLKKHVGLHDFYVGDCLSNGELAPTLRKYNDGTYGLDFGYYEGSQAEKQFIRQLKSTLQ